MNIETSVSKRAIKVEKLNLIVLSILCGVAFILSILTKQWGSLCWIFLSIIWIVRHFYVFKDMYFWKDTSDELLYVVEKYEKFFNELDSHISSDQKVDAS